MPDIMDEEVNGNVCMAMYVWLCMYGYVCMAM